MLPKILLVCNVFLSVSGQYFLKYGVNSLKNTQFNLVNLPKILFSPYVFLGFALYGISSIVWIYILKNLSLSVAYPALSIGYILVLFISYKFLGETVGVYNVIGVILIMLGVTLLFAK